MRQHKFTELDLSNIFNAVLNVQLESPLGNMSTTRHTVHSFAARLQFTSTLLFDINSMAELLQHIRGVATLAADLSTIADWPVYSIIADGCFASSPPAHTLHSRPTCM
ncbi:hypothetical protein ACJJTC_001119 [Scirpophaga incertulas]